jgi:hypothetical protein
LYLFARPSDIGISSLVTFDAMVLTQTPTLNGRPGAAFEQLLHEDTRAEMDRIMLIVKARTGPGTGFVLKGATGIGPICAYIASTK